MTSLFERWSRGIREFDPCGFEIPRETPIRNPHMTHNPADDWTEIWLEPKCAENGDGRLWSSDRPERCDDCDLEPVKYIRADLAALTSPAPAGGEGHAFSPSALPRVCAICNRDADSHGSDGWSSEPVQELHELPPPTPDVAGVVTGNRKKLQDEIERIIISRLYNRRIDGYTIEMATQIVDTVIAHSFPAVPPPPVSSDVAGIVERLRYTAAIRKRHRDDDVIAEECLAAATLLADVVELVIAARIVAFEDQSPEALRALDKAVEAFAERVPWDNEPAEEAAQ